MLKKFQFPFFKIRRMKSSTKNSTNVDVNVNVSASIDLNSITTLPRTRGTANGGGKRGASIYREAEEPGGIESRQNSTYTFGRQHVIRSNYMGKSIEAKKKVFFQYLRENLSSSLSTFFLN